MAKFEDAAQALLSQCAPNTYMAMYTFIYNTVYSSKYDPSHIMSLAARLRKIIRAYTLDVWLTTKQVVSKNDYIRKIRALVKASLGAFITPDGNRQCRMVGRLMCDLIVGASRLWNRVAAHTQSIIMRQWCRPEISSGLRNKLLKTTRM